jgi:hypothetical protein
MVKSRTSKRRGRRGSRARGSWWPFKRKLSSGYQAVKDRRWLKDNPLRTGSPDVLPVQQMINSEAAWLARTQGRRAARGINRSRRRRKSHRRRSKSRRRRSKSRRRRSKSRRRRRRR